MATEFKRQLFSGSRIEVSFEGRSEVVVVEFGDASEDFEPAVFVWPEGTNGEAEPVLLWTGKGSPEPEEAMDDMASDDYIKTHLE